MNNLVWFFAFVGFVSSYPFKERSNIEYYQACAVYGNYNQINWKDGKDRLCTSKNNLTYCKEWECPEPSCDNPKKSNSGICSNYCEGTCTYGGKEHDIGERFTSPDGFNSCWCSESNYYFCSYAGFTVQTLCNVTDT